MRGGDGRMQAGIVFGWAQDIEPITPCPAVIRFQVSRDVFEISVSRDA